MLTSEKYKSLFHMRSPFIVKSMHRMLKDSDLKRAKARARMAARADTKAKARVSDGRRDMSVFPHVQWLVYLVLRSPTFFWLTVFLDVSVTVLKLPIGNSEECSRCALRVAVFGELG